MLSLQRRQRMRLILSFNCVKTGLEVRVAAIVCLSLSIGIGLAQDCSLKSSFWLLCWYRLNKEKYPKNDQLSIIEIMFYTCSNTSSTWHSYPTRQKQNFLFRVALYLAIFWQFLSKLIYKGDRIVSTILGILILYVRDTQ